MKHRNLSRAWFLILGLTVAATATAQTETEPPGPTLPESIQVDVPDDWKDLLLQPGTEPDHELKFDYKKDGYYLRGPHALKIFGGQPAVEADPEGGAIDYQVGTIGDSPLFVTFVTPESPDAEGFFRELDESRHWEPLLHQFSGVGLIAAKCACGTVCVLTNPDGSCSKRVCATCPGDA